MRRLNTFDMRQNPYSLPERWPRLAGVCVLLLLLAVAGSRLAQAQTFSSGSDGSDGALDLTGKSGTIIFDPADATVCRRAQGTGQCDPEGDNVFHFTIITIPTSVTLRLSARQIAGPVFWLASGAVRIDGIIDLNGENGHDVSTFRRPAVPGSGGFGGGVGRTATANPTNGLGPGGGRIGSSSSECCGAGHVIPASGAAYGNDFLIPLIGGSGGAGADTGGGAGGGALLIASSNSILINGTIRANGGNGGSSTSFTSGGGGSGGAIRLIAPTISGTGTLSARGGFGNGIFGDNGSDGRIRLEASQQTFTGSATPIVIPAVSIGAIPAQRVSSVRVVSVASIPLPLHPTASFTTPDVNLNTPTAVTFEIEARNVPTGTKVQLQLLTQNLQPVLVDSTPLAGTLALSTATATATIPSGLTQVLPVATWTPPPPP